MKQNQLITMTKEERRIKFFGEHPELKEDPEFQKKAKEAYKRIAEMKKKIRAYQPA